MASPAVRKNGRLPKDVGRTLAGEPVDPSRSALMGRVRGKDSKPEKAVRRMAHALGYRFRLHARTLPGTPDLVFPGKRKVIFVHGCFWHRHPKCIRTTTPKTRAAFWADKFKQNIARDAARERELKTLGWEVLVIWECETFDDSTLKSLVKSFLSDRGRVARTTTITPRGQVRE